VYYFIQSKTGVLRVLCLNSLLLRNFSMTTLHSK